MIFRKEEWVNPPIAPIIADLDMYKKIIWSEVRKDGIIVIKIKGVIFCVVNRLKTLFQDIPSIILGSHW